jgi:hypothetical protein
MKKLLFVLSCMFMFSYTVLKEQHCYIVGGGKVTAYRMENIDTEIFGNKRKYVFYDKNNNEFFSFVTEKQPLCVPCDSSFISIYIAPQDSTKKVQNVNIQIGAGNEMR